MGVNVSFDLLSPAMQRTIYDMGWKSLRKVQHMAIPPLVQTTDDVIIAADTASGKTEAAFLPILSLVENDARSRLSVVYISPLRALINDQSRRVADLCRWLDVDVHRWHGDVPASRKAKIIQKPRGILQTTPESLESIFVNRSEIVASVFGNLTFVVIDELHAFLGTPRGRHLRSILHRLFKRTATKPRIVGLSATIGEFSEAQSWINPDHPDNVKIVNAPKEKKGTRYGLFHYELPDDHPAMVAHLLQLTKNRSAILFCNARNDVELIARNLNRLRSAEDLDGQYLVHHGSVSKDLREFTETKLREGHGIQSVVSTSTLELGIDIGSLDMVIQIDSTWSVQSLTQRLGRSGRSENAHRIFALFTGNEESLVQSIAVTELFLEDWTEPHHEISKPFDILWHQIISIVEEHHGISRNNLVSALRGNPVFKSIAVEEMEAIIDHMLEQSHLQYSHAFGELIVGLEAETIRHNRTFYAVFESTEDFTVVHNGQEIGTVPPVPQQLPPGTRFLLAGRVWEVIDVDPKRSRVFVRQAPDGSAMRWPGRGGEIHHRIRTTMAHILSTDEPIAYINPAGEETLQSLRLERRTFGLSRDDRAIVDKGNVLELQPFAGTRVQNTLTAMLRLATQKPVQALIRWGNIELQSGIDGVSILDVIETIKSNPPSVDQLLTTVADHEIATGKFGPFLPHWAQLQLHAETKFDLPTTLQFLDEVRFKLFSG